MTTHSITEKKCLSHIDMTPWTDLGWCDLCSDQGVKLSCKVPFITFEQHVEELSYKLVDGFER